MNGFSIDIVRNSFVVDISPKAINARLTNGYRPGEQSNVFEDMYVRVQGTNKYAHITIDSEGLLVAEIED